MLTKVVMDVPALHCDGCVASVADVLLALNGVQEVAGSVERKELRIDYDLSSVTPLAMKQQMALAGYPAAASRDAT